MALFKNISGINQFIEEHRRMVGPNEEIELSEEEVKSRSYAKGLAKGGWLIPVLENIVVQSVQQTIDNELDHVTHQPEQPFNIDLNIPIGGLQDTPSEPAEPATKSVQQKAIDDAIARQAELKNKEMQDAAIKRALGGYDDENIYIHNPVKSGQYGNIEHNKSELMTKIVLPPDVQEGVTYPSAKLDDAVDAMIESQMKMQFDDVNSKPQELHLEKEATKSPKVKPQSKVVKKQTK